MMRRGFELKIVSWNLNGLSSCIQNNSFAPIADIGPDILCLQEIRTQQEPQILPGYQHCWNHGLRNGYAGTAVLCKKEPLSISFGLGDDDADEEGRAIILEYKGFYLINAYVPNSQKNLIRHAYRLEWDQLLIDRVSQLRELKPVIVCGDFNVAREEIDIYPENMRQYWAGLGYASDERSDMETLVELGLVDAFRELNPDTRSYTWWSNRLNKRQQDRGWRLDYFFVDDALFPRVQQVFHHDHIMGSDHCPIELEIRV